MIRPKPGKAALAIVDPSPKVVGDPERVAVIGFDVVGGLRAIAVIGRRSSMSFGRIIDLGRRPFAPLAPSP
jgi:hypothetical protein